MWPYRHVFRAARYATQRRHTLHAARRTPHAARHVARCRHIFAHCVIRRRPSAYRRPRVYMYAEHIDTHTDYIIGLYRGANRAGAEANRPKRSDLMDNDDPDEESGCLDRWLYLSLIAEFRFLLHGD